MTELDQSAFDAANTAALKSAGWVTLDYAIAPAPGRELFWRMQQLMGVVRAAIAAYLAARRKQGYVLIHSSSVAAYDTVMERAEAHTARSISEVVTAAVEEERARCIAILHEEGGLGRSEQRIAHPEGEK